ncbi:MAG: alpha/beta fold hydrolase [Chloroflexi bacterium]|nr:alpha/beta fold hydrolase [Chloroflexota bacterium]
MQGFEELVLNRPGCAVHAWVSADIDAKPLLVMLHGAGLDHAMFQPQLRDLQAVCRMALMDLRGHGASRSLQGPFTIDDVMGDVLQLIDQLDVRRAVLLGHSMSGLIAQEFIFRMPDRCSALVSADSVCSTLPRSSAQHLMVRLFPGLLRATPERVLRSGLIGLSKRPEVRRYISTSIGRLSKQELSEIMIAAVRGFHPEPAYRLPCPLLIVRGEHQDGRRRRLCEWAARDNADYVIIPDAGHLSNMDNPRAFNKRVLEYVEHVAR